MSKLNPGQMLSNVKDPNLRALFQQLFDGVNHLSDHVGADPVGNREAPAAIQGINIKNAGELMHVTLTDNNPINKGIKYFLEYDTDPNFPQPQPLDLGTSRTHAPFSLPSKDDGGNPLSYYFRAYPQMPGSEPGPVTVYGGNNPIPVTPGSTTQMSLLPSTGSGTAAPDGRQGGYGLGRFLTRQAQGPKRNIPV